MRWALAAILFVSASAAEAQPAPSWPVFRHLTTRGVTVFGQEEIGRILRLRPGEALPAEPSALAGTLQHEYSREGYTKAVVTASFDVNSGTLALDADEGRIEAIAIEGLEDEALASDLRASLSIQPGALYNTHAVAKGARRLLAPARGAIRLREFDLVERDGLRTLVLTLRREKYRVDLTWGSDEREDWYSPADGLNVAAGFEATFFDQRRFNHTLLAGFVGYKLARERASYSLGLERPVLGAGDQPRLFLAAEIHDLTASDDFWRLSVTEQSLVALAFRNSFRDYYAARGYQLTAAYRPAPAHELLVSWRDERHEPVLNRADFSVFRDSHTFRPNAAADRGRLRAIVVGYTLDSRGLDGESRRTTYRRHVGQRLFGHHGGSDRGLRLEAASEIAPGAFGGEFAFSRHVANLRVYAPVAPAQRLRARFVAGGATGTLPAQRMFALGGIGTVHGYAFKQENGEGMVLANLEYHLGSPRHGRLIGFLDAGKVLEPAGAATGAWMRGIGIGFGLGDLRLDLGWRLDDVPGSLQVLVRFGPTF